MNAQVIIAGVSLLASLVGKITDSASVNNIITILEAWLPTIISEIQSLVPVVQGIIATLKGSDVLTADQIAAIDALNAQVDADFDAAAAAALKG